MRKARRDRVAASGQLAEHALGVLGTGGLFKYACAETYYRIRGNDQTVPAHLRSNTFGLAHGYIFHRLVGRQRCGISGLAGGGHDGEIPYSYHFEQLAPTGRGGGQYDPAFHSILPFVFVSRGGRRYRNIMVNKRHASGRRERGTICNTISISYQTGLANMKRSEKETRVPY